MDIYKTLKTKYKKLFEELDAEFTLENLQELKIYDMHLNDSNITSKYTPKLIKEKNGSIYESLIVRKDYLDEYKKARNLKILGSDTGYSAYANASFENFIKDTDDRRLAGLAAEKFCKDFEMGKKSKGLYINGSYRTGKTYLACCIANRLSVNYKIAFVFLPDFIRRIVFHDFNNQFIEEKIQELKQCDVLFLDDIGAGSKSAWFRDSVLLPIVQERLNNQKPIIFTSNYIISTLVQFLAATGNDKQISLYDEEASKRLVVRINEMTKSVKLSKEVSK